MSGIKRVCKIGHNYVRMFRDCSFYGAAVNAVEDFAHENGWDLLLKRDQAYPSVDVSVEDLESGLTRVIRIEPIVTFKWMNPREGLDSATKVESNPA